MVKELREKIEKGESGEVFQLIEGITYRQFRQVLVKDTSIILRRLMLISNKNHPILHKKGKTKILGYILRWIAEEGNEYVKACVHVCRADQVAFRRYYCKGKRLEEVYKMKKSSEQGYLNFV